MEEENEKVCKCGRESEGYHSCPYAEEINDDYDKRYCNCCEECMQQCMDDI